MVLMMKFKMMGELSRKEIHDTYFHLSQLVFLLATGYLVSGWLFKLWRAYKQLKNERTEAELMLLKSKIDPHFFFNTLNNLYGLALEKSDDTPEVILKLSDIMRYTIYDGEKDVVPLKDEVAYLEKYLEIHKIRYKKQVSIKFTQSIDNDTIKIAPLLFIMLVENAIKHGVETLVNDAFVNITLSSNGKTIMFHVENNFDPKEKPSGGFGLENLRRRLHLLYSGNHELVVNSDPAKKVFTAHLTIQIK